MDIQIKGRGLFTTALVRLEPGEKFVSQAGAMYRASSNVDIDVTTRTRGGSGGLLGGLKRLFASTSFFFSTYEVTDSRPGEVGLAPTHSGEIKLLHLDGSRRWFCTGGSYLASSESLALDTQFQGMKGFFTGESLSFLTVTGSGDLLVASFGRISELEVSDGLIVDTGHVVAFEDSLEYSISKAGSSWFHSWLAGEGLVMKFNGHGKILVQSHNLTEFGNALGPLLPARS